MGRVRYVTKNKTKCNYKCAAYIRLSQEDGDKEESNSVTTQREIIDYYLKKNKNIELIDYYIDDGFTGTDFNRPSFQRMLDDIESRKVNTVIVKDLSRFGRNYVEVGNFIEQIFPIYNIRFIAISDKIDNFLYPDSLNSIIFPFKNMINEEYARDISKKVKSAKMTRIKKGDFMAGHAPYGYIKNPEDKHRFLIDPEAAKVVKKIFEMFLEGNGYATIVRYLNDNDIYPPAKYKCLIQKIKYANSNTNANNINDKKWSIRAVRGILNNQVYIGNQVQCKEKVLSFKNHKIIRNDEKDWIIVENTHEPIISKIDFEKVQTILKNKTYTGAQKGAINLYAGHLKCAKCGKFMIRKYTGRRRSNKEILNYNYYCSTYVNVSHNDCILNKVRSEELDNIILKAIKHQVKLYLKIDSLLKNISEINNNIDDKQRLINIEQEINDRRKMKQKFYEDWKTGIITKEDYLDYVKGAEKTLNILNERYKKYSLKCAEDEKILDNRELFKNLNIYSDIKTLTKDIVDEFIDKIYAYEDGKIEIVFKYQDEYKNLLKCVRKSNKST